MQSRLRGNGGIRIRYCRFRPSRQGEGVQSGRCWVSHLKGLVGEVEEVQDKLVLRVFRRESLRRELFRVVEVEVGSKQGLMANSRRNREC